MSNMDINGNQRGSTKKRLIIIFFVSLGIILLLSVAVMLIERLRQSPYEDMTKVLDYDFAYADFSEDIFQDDEYIKIIERGYLYFCDSSTGVTVGYEPADAENYGSDLVFLTEYIQTAIQGDYQAYNEMFSDIYYKEHAVKEAFTMQKIYDVYFTRTSSSEITENGRTFHSYDYTVEYKILDNNGTFRNDIGTGTRKQFFTITDRTGELLIDAIGVVLN